MNEFYLKGYPTKKYFKNVFKTDEEEVLSLESICFKPAGQPFPSKKWKNDIIRQYKEQTDFPSVNGTSRLSIHLRFGTISIREPAKKNSVAK